MASTQRQLALKILVDKDKNRVLFAEADNDFVDTLLSFLTLPLGTIVRLVSNPLDPQPVMIGSLRNLYKSVENLGTKYLSTEACKAMLLQPRNSSESVCKKLKLNIDDTEATRYFVHEKSNCCMVSTYKYMRCSCGCWMNKEVVLEEADVKANTTGARVFVTEQALFIITDDLRLMPNLPGTNIALLRNLGIKSTVALEERTLNVNLKQILKLLKCSLLSKTPLTDLFLRKKQFYDTMDSEPYNFPKSPIKEEAATGSTKMTVNIFTRVSSNKVLFAQAEEDFVNLLFSLLTIPLGRVVNLLGGNTSTSIDNLYRSVADLNVDRFLRSQDLKNTLLYPNLAPQFLCENQVLPISEEPTPQLFRYRDFSSSIYLTTDTYSKHKLIPLTFKNPKVLVSKTTVQGGFARASTVFMVTDDLVVTPLSAMSGISLLNRSKIPLTDLEEQEVSIGMKEALIILYASLNSSSALTTALELISMKPKQEKI